MSHIQRNSTHPDSKGTTRSRIRTRNLLSGLCLLVLALVAACRPVPPSAEPRPETPPAGASTVIKLDPAQAHTLKLVLPGLKRWLNVTEIEVWSGGKNIAPECKVDASSSTLSPPAAVVDGVTTTKDEAGNLHLLHSNAEPSPWCTLQLPPGISGIDKIIIHNRNDERTSSWRLLPFTLELTDSQGRQVWSTTIRRLPGVSPMTGYFKIPVNAQGFIKESAASATRESYAVKTLSRPPTMDGKIKDDEWSEADPITAFKVAKTVANTNRVPPTFPTEARIGSDASGLYFSFKLPQTSGPRRRADQRDGQVGLDDSVEILIEPKAGSGEFFHWIVNAKGIVFDEHGKDPAWNGNATFRVSPWDGKEWQVVGHIPWSDLGVEPGGARVIGFNVLRNIAGAELETSAFALIEESALRPDKFALASLNGDPSAISEFLAQSSDAHELERLRQSLKAADVGNLPGNDAPAGLRAMAERLEKAKRLAADQLSNPGDKPDLEAISALLKEANELAAALPVLVEAWKKSARDPSDRFMLSTASPLQHVFLEAGRLQPDFNALRTLRSARNEHEGFQVQVVPFDGDLKDVRWTLSPLTGKDGSTIQGKVFVVAYVYCEETVYMPGQPAGWYPDGLADFADRIPRVPMGEILNLWVRVHVPADAVPGEYSGNLTVTAANATPKVLNVTAKVDSFVLPVKSSFLTLCDLMVSRDEGFSKFYPRERLAELKRRTEDMLLDEYRFNAASFGVSPLSDPFSWSADRLIELKPKGLQLFPLVYTDWPPGTAEQVAQNALTEIRRVMPEIEKAGMRDQAAFYSFDEWPPEKFDKMIDIIRRIKTEYPDIQVVTTALSYWGLKDAERDEARIVDWWVPLISLFEEQPDRIRRLKERGQKVAWYICQFPEPPYPGVMVEQPPADLRLLMGAMAHKYQSDGFLFWTFNSWVLNSAPIASLPRCEFNPNTFNGPNLYNGAGHLLLPGPNGPIPTVRMESIRDGLEDYECYLILERLLKQKGLPPDAATVPKTVVENLTRFTKDPGVIEAERNRVADEIERVSLLPDVNPVTTPASTSP